MLSNGSSPKTASSTASTNQSPDDDEHGSGVHPNPGRGVRRFFSQYSLVAARGDLQAALTVAVISLPQSMAYALIAGVDPRYGLYTAMVMTAVAGIFGSSSHLINGPTGAVSLVVFSTLSFFDPDARVEAAEGMFLLAVMIGIIQILISVLKLGDLTRYISESVITGFMSGAATLTVVGQIGNALGLKNQGTGHQHVFARLWLTLTQDAPVNWRAIAISGGSIVLALLGRRLVRRYKLPQLDMFVVLLLVVVPAYFLGWSQANAAGKTALSLIEEVPASLPRLHVAEIKWSYVGQLSSGAFAIAFLGLLETLAIAKAISYKTRQPLDFNRQCMAEGLGNLVGGFFRCMPGAGSLSRSAINHQAGAVTKLSGVYTAALVAVMVLLLAPLTRYIPKAALAGLLIVAASRLIDLDRARYILRTGRYDAALLLLTAAATLIVGVEFSILIGVALSLVLFAPRVAKLHVAELIVTEERVVRERLESDARCHAVRIADFEGELFFAAVPDFSLQLQRVVAEARVDGVTHLVFRLKRLRNPDAVGLEALEHLVRETSKAGFTILLAGVRPDLMKALHRLAFFEWFPSENCFAEEDEVFSATLKAVRKAYTLLGPDNDCPHCNPRVVHERAVGASASYYLV